MSTAKQSYHYVYMVAGVASMGGFLFGYDQGNMSEILQMKRFLSYFNEPDTLQQSIITSMLTLGCFLGALLAAPLADRISRKYTIVAACVVFIIGSALQTGSINQGMLIASRIIAGLGVGILSMIVPLFQSEIAPPEIRGRLVTLQQFAITIGIMVAFWIGYGSSKIDGTASFRLPLGIQIVPGLILLVSILFMPFSPRWLVDKDREDEALVVLAKLRAGGDTEAPHVLEEFNQIRELARKEKEISARSYLDLFRGNVRRRVLLGIGIQMLQQLTGINVVMYYAPKIFKQTGLTGDSAPLLAQGLNGCLNVLCTIPAILYIDRLGRRMTMIAGAAGMAISYLIIGVVMGTHGTPKEDGADMSMVFDNKAASKATIAFVYIFVASFACSWGPIGWIYPSEIFPMRVRAKGNSLTTAANWLFNFGVAQIAPIVMHKITWGLYIIFACLNLLALVCAFLFYPETKGVQLEDMDKVFSQSVWAFKVRKPEPTSPPNEKEYVGGAAYEFPTAIEGNNMA
ncbi:hypothetical protein H4219_003529 [Mycoemilia scoparia]|uniref:Major facilitator superfamily (MFS) profile domain-containing protein n=1 Tax=Mycoemilia scoparia TaxID=417184 RepID=A0A9W7ZUQ0_9FUNG|nr:hypothetical protein H4219_003529 [Mycoemilia scoparia]